MMNRHSKKELTRLILTALVLAGGSLYGPVAEADVTISGTEASDSQMQATGASKNTSMTAWVIYPGNNSQNTMTINGVHTNYQNYSFYGTVNSKYYDSYVVKLNNGTLNNIAGFFADTGGMSLGSGGHVEIYGGHVKGNTVGANTLHGLTEGNTVKISGDNITIDGDIGGGYVIQLRYSNSNPLNYDGAVKNNTVTINAKVSPQNIFGGKVAGIANDDTSATETVNQLVYNGNTLNLGPKAQITASGTVGGFATIALQSGLGFNHERTVLSATGGNSWRG